VSFGAEYFRQDRQFDAKTIMPLQYAALNILPWADILSEQAKPLGVSTMNQGS
jgi:hypothetical protein